MRRAAVKSMTVDQLVDRFVAIALEQDHAMFEDDNRKYTRLYWQMEVIKEELKSRTGDQRRALTRLYQHRNAQVRLKAAIATLAVAPQAARQVLEIINDRDEFPQAADAFGMIRALDNGTFLPT